MTSFLVGLLGEGIQHSLTPPMHVTEAELLGVGYEYRILDLLELGEDPRSTPEIVRRARDDGFAALNVTYPCKQLVIPVLDELSPEAARLDAVNLVLFRDGRMIGHNTDWTGFRSALTAGLPGERMETVTQVGTGGAGAATAYALLSVGVKRALPERPRSAAGGGGGGQLPVVVPRSSRSPWSSGRCARLGARRLGRCGQRDPDGDGAAPRHGRRRRRAQGRRVGGRHRLRTDRDRAPPRRSLGGPSRARRRPDGGRAGGRQHPPDHGAGARRGSHAEALPRTHRDPIVRRSDGGAVVRASIATVCISGSLREKLTAIARAGFDGYELFENDFVTSTLSAEEVRERSADLGLTLDLYQPFRDIEGTSPETFAGALERARRKFDLMNRLGVDLMLVCSNVGTATIDDDALAARTVARHGVGGGRPRGAAGVRGAGLGAVRLHLRPLVADRAGRRPSGAGALPGQLPHPVARQRPLDDRRDPRRQAAVLPARRCAGHAPGCAELEQALPPVPRGGRLGPHRLRHPRARRRLRGTALARGVQRCVPAGRSLGHRARRAALAARARRRRAPAPGRRLPGAGSDPGGRTTERLRIHRAAAGGGRRRARDARPARLPPAWPAPPQERRALGAGGCPRHRERRPRRARSASGRRGAGGRRRRAVLEARRRAQVTPHRSRSAARRGDAERDRGTRRHRVLLHTAGRGRPLGGRVRAPCDGLGRRRAHRHRPPRARAAVAARR